MQRHRKDVEAALLKKGFRLQEGDHHYYEYYTPDGESTGIFTKTSHSGKEIYDGLLSEMSRQCRFIKKKDFLHLIDCPMSRMEYYEYLINTGALDVPAVE